MRHISILVPEGKVVLSSVIGSYKIFNHVNEYLLQTGQRKEPLFKIDLVGVNNSTTLYNGLFDINPNKTIEDVDSTDLIIVTTITGDMNISLALNNPFVKWIRTQRISHSCEVASLCTGAFLLAETGLLNGKSCATHWIAHEDFRRRYPQINLVPENIITEDNGLYSSGGAYSFLNLLLYLVEKYSGRETAIWCSKLFEIEFDRTNQNQFVIFSGQKDHDDQAILNAQTFIEQHFNEKLSVSRLAQKFSVSRRSFVRRFKKATSNTPLEYIRRVKVEAAKKSLEATPQSVSQVMYQVGYNDGKAFRNTFRKYTGLSPVQYRNKYNRETGMI